MASNSELFRPLIWVEGIIGAGKSTFSREIAKRLELRLIEEPVETNPYLEKFYQDLIREAESALLPWAHAIRVVRIPWDFDVHSPEQWDSVALTVQDSCRSFTTIK